MEKLSKTTLFASLVAVMILSFSVTQYVDAQPTATVQGKVFTDTNGNGIQDAGELGYSGYEMYAINTATGVVQSGATSSDGSYLFSVNADERTLIQTGFFPAGHTVVDPTTSWFIYVEPSAYMTETFNVGFYPVPADEKVTLNIVTYLDENGNGNMDEGEEGIEGLTFIAYTYTIGPVSYPVTGIDGTVTVTDLVPADFALLVDINTLSRYYGYFWTSTDYERDDSLTGKSYLRDRSVSNNPDPGSIHTMTLGLVEADPIYLPVDEWLSYGSLEWAVKNYNNQYPDKDAEFGRTVLGTDNTVIGADGMEEKVPNDCAAGNAETNFAKLNVKNGGSSEQIAWQAVFQGTDPWGNKSTVDLDTISNPEDSIHSSVFKHLGHIEETGTKSITSEMQWCWTNSLQPDGTDDDVRGNILMNLWYHDADSNKAVVLDLLFDRVINTNGEWIQDTSLSVGDNYSAPKTTTQSGNMTVYHYGVVVNDLNAAANVVQNNHIVDVNGYIDDAFGYSYPNDDGPGFRSDYVLTSVECGVEITNVGTTDGGQLGIQVYKCDAVH